RTAARRQGADEGRRLPARDAAEGEHALLLTLSYPAKAGYPVRRGLRGLTETPRRTGSSAFADDDSPTGLRCLATSSSSNITGRRFPAGRSRTTRRRCRARWRRR